MIRALLVAVLVLVTALGWSLWRAERHKGAAETAANDARIAAASAEAISELLAAERESAAKMQDVGVTHEEDRKDAEQLPASVVAGIADGTLRLRQQWAACETARLSEVGAAAAERDALAELRRKDQGDLVRVGRDADDQVRACQAIVMKDRE